MIGSRPEYLLSIKGNAVKPDDRSPRHNEPINVVDDAMNNDAVGVAQQDRLFEVPLPPLPLGNGHGDEMSSAADGDLDIDDDHLSDGNQPGRFVANDRIDEGVRLIAKLQHGASLDERALAPGTRSRRAAVKVICVARCPYGGHFATGSDDGICRIWKDEDDGLSERIDTELDGRQAATSRHSLRKLCIFFIAAVRFFLRILTL